MSRALCKLCCKEPLLCQCDTQIYAHSGLLLCSELSKKSGSEEKGMVLISTIIMLMLLALLVISQMQMVSLVYQSLNRFMEKHQDFYRLEVAAQQLMANHWQVKANCLITEKNPNEIITLLKNKQGCLLSYERQQFLYLVEDLGIFPCIQTVKEKTTYSTRHWRISVLAIEGKFAFLQLRIAKKTQLAVCENSPLVFINPGILSWRYLDSVL
jgi:type II secretory pathway component PulJ